MPHYGAVMLFKYMCKSMGLRCSFSLTGETVEEITVKAYEHVMEKHADEFNIPVTPEEIEKMHQSLARSTHVVNG